MKGRPKKFLFLDENLLCVCLRKACDSVSAAVRDVSLSQPSSCCWPSPPLSWQGGSVELIHLKASSFLPWELVTQGGAGKEGAKLQTRKGQKVGRLIYR